MAPTAEAADSSSREAFAAMAEAAAQTDQAEAGCEETRAGKASREEVREAGPQPPERRLAFDCRDFFGT
jgi:hypothetical protein